MASSISFRAEPHREVDRLAVVLVVLAAISLGVAGVAVSRSSVFHARSLEVSGTSHLSRAMVVAQAEVSRETNVVWLDEGAVERRLLSHPWIAAAEVGSAFPSTIRIRVVERSPVAIAVDGARRVLVAGDGTMLGPAGRERALPTIELPPVGGPEGPRPPVTGAARALGAMDPEILALVRRVDVRLDGTLQIRMQDGLRVEFGLASRSGRKAAALADVLRWAKAEGLAIRVVNVVAPEAPAISLG